MTVSIPSPDPSPLLGHITDLLDGVHAMPPNMCLWEQMRWRPPESASDAVALAGAWDERAVGGGCR